MAQMSDTARGEQPNQQVPPVARRTYAALRLGMVAVLVGLGYALYREIQSAPGDCVNRSISAYYYTPVRSVFVGALIALGLAMVALWGKTVFEDACLNLAGMLAPVVAFVPTLDANYCSLVTASGGVQQPAQQTDEDAEAAKQALIAANSDAVNNNFSSLLVVIGIALAIALLLIIRAAASGLTGEVWGYILTWVAAFALWLLGLIRFNTDEGWFDREAHWTSAVIMFVFVILAVLAAGHTGKGWWGRTYWVLGVGMIAAAAFIFLSASWFWEDTWWGEHKIFLIEAALIFLFAVFWLVQTFERYDDGAPTYT
jgi:hypothetical protein